jgi:hypothetical protein
MAAARQVDHRYVLGGAWLLAAAGMFLQDSPLTAGIISPLIGSALVVAGAVLFAWGVYIWQARAGRVFDERFVLHRLKSTRLAAVVGLVSMLAWFAYQASARQIYRWDLLAIAGVVALTKMGAMLYYRLSD